MNFSRLSVFVADIKFFNVKLLIATGFIYFKSLARERESFESTDEILLLYD